MRLSSCSTAPKIGLTLVTSLNLMVLDICFFNLGGHIVEIVDLIGTNPLYLTWLVPKESRDDIRSHKSPLRTSFIMSLPYLGITMTQGKCLVCICVCVQRSE